jgi:2-oxoglutarate/2-oxoacid ferredoxin oxidoreductase subunit beta
MDRDLVWMIGDKTGEGVDSAGEVFAAGAARSGLEVHTLRLFPPIIKGGPTSYEVRMGTRPLHVTHLIEDGIRHRGFALINAISPCPTYDRLHTYQWWRERLVNVDADPAYQPASREQAMEAVMTRDGVIAGLIYHGEARPLDMRLPRFRATPLAEESLAPDVEAVRRILDEELTP